MWRVALFRFEVDPYCHCFYRILLGKSQSFVFGSWPESTRLFNGPMPSCRSKREGPRMLRERLGFVHLNFRAPLSRKWGQKWLLYWTNVFWLPQTREQTQVELSSCQAKIVDLEKALAERGQVTKTRDGDRNSRVLLALAVLHVFLAALFLGWSYAAQVCRRFLWLHFLHVWCHSSVLCALLYVPCSSFWFCVLLGAEDHLKPLARDWVRSHFQVLFELFLS